MKLLFLILLIILLPLTVHGQGVEASKIRKTTFANLGSPTDGQVRECTNCAVTAVTGVCATGGSEPVMARANGTAWICSTLRPPAASPAATPGGSNGDIEYNNAGAFGGKSLATLKSDLSLSNVDNTSDANKPVSTAEQAALDLKENVANKDTDVTLAANSDTKYPSQKAAKTYIDTAVALKANLISPSFTTPSLGVASYTSLAGGAIISTATITSGIANGFRIGARGLISASSNGQFTFFLDDATTPATLNIGPLNATNVTASSLTLSGNISAPTWTTSGVRLKSAAATLTDTTAATGTTATQVTNALGGNTIAATNAGVIYTHYATLLLTGPTAGTNVTVTNPLALLTNGNVYINKGATSSAQTDLKINPAVKASGDLFWAGVNDVSKFSVTFAGNTTTTGYVDASQFLVGGNGRVSTAGFLNRSSSMHYLNGASSMYRWTDNADGGAGTADTNIYRSSAGVIGLGTSAANGLGSLLATGTTLSSATVPITFSNAAYQSCAGFTSTAGGVLTCTPSDKRVKQGFLSFTRGMDAIRKIQPQSFSFSPGTRFYDSGKRRTGFIAQDIQSVVPEAVSSIGDGTLQVDNAVLLATAVNALKELDGKIQKLEIAFKVASDKHVGPATYCYDRRRNRVPCWKGQSLRNRQAK